MTYDASPLSTVPPDLTPLPEGKYALPLMLTRSPTTCFNDSTQAQAWNCNQVFAQLSLSISELTNTPSTSQYAMSLSFNDSFTIESNEYSYGMQPPSVSDVKMLLVSDVNEPSRGPAWAFEVEYDKTVIIPESLFPTPSGSASKSKRTGALPPPDGVNFPGPGGGDFKRKGLAQSGDKPWICYWNGTILEVFVYPNQNNSQPTLSYSGGVSASSPGRGSDSFAAASATVTSTTSTATAATATGEWGATNYRDEYATTMHVRRQATSLTTTAATAASTTSSVSSGVFDTSMPKPSDFQVPFFPRVVKMEERRLPGDPSVQPYCRQYQINGDGSPATPIKDSNGNFVEVQIVEIEPDGHTEHERKESREGRYVVRKALDDYMPHGMRPRDSDSDMSNCGCMWWTT